MPAVLRTLDIDESRLELLMSVGMTLRATDIDTSRLVNAKYIAPVHLSEYTDFTIGSTTMLLRDWCYEEIT